MGEGDVWIRCHSDHSVFVQSYYLDRYILVAIWEQNIIKIFVVELSLVGRLRLGAFEIFQILKSRSFSRLRLSAPAKKINLEKKSYLSRKIQ